MAIINDYTYIIRVIPEGGSDDITDYNYGLCWEQRKYYCSNCHSMVPNFKTELTLKGKVSANPGKCPFCGKKFYGLEKVVGKPTAANFSLVPQDKKINLKDINFYLYPFFCDY